MYPFYAYLLKGARFVPSQAADNYRVHSRKNTSLSLRGEKQIRLKRREMEERAYVIHLAHATLMEEELDRLRVEEPERYGPVAEQIMPLLAIQMAEMSKKLVRSRRTHGEF